jgi:hypothetical protein
MLTPVNEVKLLGELVVAAFDRAALCSADPQEINRLAKMSLRFVLRRGRWPAQTELSAHATARRRFTAAVPLWRFRLACPDRPRAPELP